MRPENEKMRQFLQENGIECSVKYISDGSLKKTWRLYKKGEKWTEELAQKLTALGFVDFDWKPLSWLSGNGGLFSVFVRGYNELV